MGIADIPASRPMDSYVNTHDYSHWEANATAQLCNVPYDSSYRDIVRFKDQNARDTYFNQLDSQSVIITRGTVVRFGEPVRLPIQFDLACRYNYMVVSHGQSGNQRKWYYFIQDVQYHAGVTEFYLQLDVWTSFQFDVAFGRCYIERGHIAIANENVNVTTPHQMRNYLNIPEGLDVGAEYVVNRQDWKELMSPSNCGVLIVSTTQLEATWKDSNTGEKVLTTATGSKFQKFPSGTSEYYCDSFDHFRQFMALIGKYPNMSQGICSITCIPALVTHNLLKITTNGIPSGVLYSLNSVTSPAIKAKFSFALKNFRGYFNIPGRYAKLIKFFTYPYTAIEITALNGNALQIRPESVNDTTLRIVADWFLNQPGQRVVVRPKGINSNARAGIRDIRTSEGTTLETGENFDVSLSIDNLPQTNVVNNSTIAYMASNQHSIKFQYANASWAQQKTQLGINQASETNAIRNQYSAQGANLANDNRRNSQVIANNGAIRGTLINGATTLAGGLAGGAAGVGSAALGLAGDAMNTANQISTANQQTALANSYNSASNKLSIGENNALTDTNNAYAAQAMKGDYANAIAGINATVQDAKMLQPSVSGQTGGDAFNLAHGMTGVLVKFKTCDPAAIANIGEFWLRYGYNVQRFATPPTDLQCMTKATYWKMSETYLRAAMCPEPYRMAIRGIFEKGVTVYSNPSYIGVMDFADQRALPNIYY